LFGPSTTSIYINQGKKKGKRAAVKKDFNLGREAYFGFLVRECPHIPKILLMDQSNDSVWKKEK
jgi:hypothetical protein